MARGSLKLDDQLCFALYKATNAIVRSYRRPLAALGLTYLQYLVMMVLWDEGGHTVGSLATRLDLDSSTLTPLLKRLEAAGFLTRSRDPHNQRVVRIATTAAGRALEPAARAIQSGVACRTGLPDGPFTALRGQLHRLAGDLATADAGAADRLPVPAEVG